LWVDYHLSLQCTHIKTLSQGTEKKSWLFWGGRKKKSRNRNHFYIDFILIVLFVPFLSNIKKFTKEKKVTFCALMWVVAKLVVA